MNTKNKTNAKLVWSKFWQFAFRCGNKSKRVVIFNLVVKKFAYSPHCLFIVCISIHIWDDKIMIKIMFFSLRWSKLVTKIMNKLTSNINKYHGRILIMYKKCCYFLCEKTIIIIVYINGILLLLTTSQAYIK